MKLMGFTVHLVHLCWSKVPLVNAVIHAAIENQSEREASSDRTDSPLNPSWELCWNTFWI